MENNPSTGAENPFDGFSKAGSEKSAKTKAEKSRDAKPTPSLATIFERTEKAKATKRGESILDKLAGGKKDDTPKPAEKAASKESTVDEQASAPAAERAEKDEPTDAIEGEIKIDHLSHEESREVASDYISLRHEAVQEELAEVRAGTEGEEAAKANALQLENAQEQIAANKEATVAEALDAADDQTIAELAAQDRAEASVPPFEAMAAEAMAHQQIEAASAKPSSAPVERVMRRAETATENSDSREPASREWYPSLVPWGNEVWNRRYGHLLRHRRERLKTEQNIKAAEKNLQQEVRDVQAQVAKHEVGIRRFAAERARQQNGQQVEQGSAAVPPHTHERYIAGAWEAVMPPPPTPPETHAARLGEAVAPRRPIERPGKEQVGLSKADTLPHDDLLRESAGINVSGVTLRSVYEAKRISEPGLRRLVDEYYRGGDMQLALAQEMVEHERAFERDPILRDDHPMHEWLYAGGAAAATNAGTIPDPGSSSASKATTPAASAAAARQSQQKKQRISDTQFMTAGFTLLFIIIVLIVIIVLQR